MDEIVTIPAVHQADSLRGLIQTEFRERFVPLPIRLSCLIVILCDGCGRCVCLMVLGITTAFATPSPPATPPARPSKLDEPRVR